MDADRKQILESLLDVIAGISDKEYQKRVWIRGEGPEVDDFDETTNNFIGDGKFILREYKIFGITDQQYDLLKTLWDNYDAFCSGVALKYYLPENFINTPEWTHVTELAQGVIKSFNYQCDHRK